jgi:adenosylcobinamide-phosphate synthase
VVRVLRGGQRDDRAGSWRIGVPAPRRPGAVAASLADAAGLVAGFALDRAFGDPRRFHPVAGFGTAAVALEGRLHAHNRAAGAAFTAVAVGLPVLAGVAAHVATRRRPLARTGLVAAATWAVLGGRTARR